MSAEQPTLSAPVTQLATLLIPVKGKQLLLPNVSVAEIIHYLYPQPLDDVPTWLLGTIEWRNQVLPMISFEAINDEPFVSHEGPRRIAVFNGMLDERKLPFYAVLTRGVPRLMRLQPEDISRDDAIPCGPAESMVVSVNGEQAVIPDLEYIENQILRLL